MKRVVILISGRGSNMAAILAAARAGRIPAKIAAVISNRPSAPGLAIAGEHGVATTVVDHTAFADRPGFERELAAAIDAHAPDLVVLAGFMRVLGAAFVGCYAGRLLNVHPSLLPAYPGLHTHRRALADGVKVHGCTVHFVTHDVDHGPIVAQAAVAVREDDDEASLAARVLTAEHRILVAAVRWFCEGRLVIDAGRVRVKEEVARAADLPETLLVPAQS
ncbi:MAG TPA: phosphoribosylglycinamide formyltransferase [Casimicrobiaceae bacterium]|nr:phosphoribosylglycinamide formyltransferase [Casimicrobiaceae bacterium]